MQGFGENVEEFRENIRRHAIAVMGDDFPKLAANLRENLVEGRTRVIQLVARAAAG